MNKKKIEEKEDQLKLNLRHFSMNFFVYLIDNEKLEKDKESHNLQQKNKELGSEIADLVRSIRTLSQNKELILSIYINLIHFRK